MKAYRVACVPSICNEGYSLLAAEAFSLGMQVVIADSESLQHFREPPFDAIPAKVHEPASLAEAISMALTRPKKSAEATMALQDALGTRSFQHRLQNLLKEFSL